MEEKGYCGGGDETTLWSSTPPHTINWITRFVYKRKRDFAPVQRSRYMAAHVYGLFAPRVTSLAVRPMSFFSGQQKRGLIFIHNTTRASHQWSIPKGNALFKECSEGKMEMTTKWTVLARLSFCCPLVLDAKVLSLCHILGFRTRLTENTSNAIFLQTVLNHTWSWSHDKNRVLCILVVFTTCYIYVIFDSNSWKVPFEVLRCNYLYFNPNGMKIALSVPCKCYKLCGRPETINPFHTIMRLWINLFSILIILGG